MPQWEVLGFEQHGTLGIGAVSDADRQFVQIVIGEFAAAATDYPIFFAKRPDTGRFYAGALLALKAGEQSIDERGRLRSYRPADLERQGFFVDADRVVIDREQPAFVDGAGAPLFEPDGRHGDALRRVQHALAQLHLGLPETDAFIDRLLELSLLEAIDIRLSFDDGESLVFEDLYTISVDALGALPDATALAMFRNGDLAACHMQQQSVRHVARMARLRNDRLAGLSA